MLKKPYLLLDAGGTVVFPNSKLISKIAQSYQITLTNKRLYNGYYQLIYALDSQEPFPQNPWPDGYVQALLHVLKLSTPNAKNFALEVNDYHKTKSLWTFTYPWVYKALSRLRGLGYQMSILSNSDGRTREIFDELNLSQYFEHVFDSRCLHYEKPDQRIFDIVLEKLDIHPRNILYVGDLYKVDILGANRAGIGGIHLDPLQIYRHLPGIHINDITFLESWLALNLDKPIYLLTDLFPFSKKSTLEPYMISELFRSNTVTN